MAWKIVVYTVSLTVIFATSGGDGWRAVPANQADYAVRAIERAGVELDEDEVVDKSVGDESLPRVSLLSVYKFGWCTNEMVRRQYLRKNVTIHFINYWETLIKYIYASPGGMINYVSPSYGGSATDRQIIERSSILNRFDYNDEIMVDKGLNVQDIFVPYGVKVIEHKHTQRYAQQCVVMKFYVPKKYMFRRSRIPMYYCQGIVHYLLANTIQKIQLHEFFIVGELKMPLDIKVEFYHPTTYKDPLMPENALTVE